MSAPDDRCATTAAGSLRAWLDDGTLDLPRPGAGATATRWRRLAALARHHDVSLARLAEAHVDATAILAEAGREPVPGAIYGVWASDATGHELRLVGDRLLGCKRFCSGLGIVDRALVTVIDGDGKGLLVDVDVRAGEHVVHDTSAWATPALAGTATGDVAFRGRCVAPEEIVHDGARWYLDRPGFWHGACGPAACWAGAASGLVDVVRERMRDEPHTIAHLGAMEAAVWTMTAVLDRAGRATDDRPEDVEGARARARAVRHVVERHCTEIVDRFGRALGPRPAAHDAAVGQRIADVLLYIRQHHAERDLEALGRESGALSR